MTEFKKTINPKGETTSFKSTCDMTFKLNEPKLFSLSKHQKTINQIKPINQSKQDENKNSMQNIAKETKKKKNAPKMRQKLLEYYDNPFAYIDYLLEQYFRKKLSFHSDEEVKAKIKEDFENFFKGINLKLNQFKNKQKAKLKELDDQIELRLKTKRNKYILKDTDELSTEPLYNKEDIEDIFLEQAISKYTTIVSSIPPSKQAILNDIQSKYYAPNISRQVLCCLEENKTKLNPPQRSFIQSDTITVNSNNRDGLLQMKHLLDKDRAKEQNEERYEENIAHEVKKTLEVQKKMFDDIIAKTNGDLEKYDAVARQYTDLLQYMKTNLEKNKMFDNLTMSQLALFKYDIDTIKKRLLSSDNECDSIDFIGKKKVMIQYEVNECNEMIADCFRRHGNQKPIGINEIIDDNVDMLYCKMMNERKDKDDIENRIYYNDNPYHYHYNYIGASIPIAKNLTKTYDQAIK